MTVPTPTRRIVVRGAAWSVPAVVVAGSAPAYAASGPLAVAISTPGLAGSGFDLNLRDTKATNSATNISPSSVTVVNLTLTVTAAGVPLAGATVSVVGDATKDGEGNYMIGFSPATQTTGFGESPVQKTATVTTDAAGQVVVKVSTATYGAIDCGAIPRSGTWTVTVTAPGFAPLVVSFTYVVTDGPIAVVC